MTKTFTPPTVRDRPPFLPDSTPDQVDLYRHYENRLRGVNVWKLSDGTYVQDTASSENTNTDMSNVYPWNPDDPSAPYVHVQNWGGSVTDISHSVYPVAFYAGGHSHVVTDAEAADLTAYVAHGTGYAGNLT